MTKKKNKLVGSMFIFQERGMNCYTMQKICKYFWLNYTSYTYFKFNVTSDEQKKTEINNPSLLKP